MEKENPMSHSDTLIRPESPIPDPYMNPPIVCFVCRLNETQLIEPRLPEINSWSPLSVPPPDLRPFQVEKTQLGLE